MGRSKTWISAMAALALGMGTPVLAESGNGVGTPFELAFWQSVMGSDDAALYEAYLQQYPMGTFSTLAKVKAASLRNSSSAAAVLAPAVQALPGAPPAIAATVTAVAVVPAPVPALVPATATQAAADSALLTELARSQETGGVTMQVAAAQGFALPARPALDAVPDLPLPAMFCSSEQRNAFFETRYNPVLEMARANNAAANSHMQRLQQVYDSLQLARDPAPMNAVAFEARDYQQQVATMTYSRQAAMVRQFDAIMALPIGACQVAAAAK